MEDHAPPESSGESVPIINTHAAKTHLSRLVEQAAQGRSFVIAKAGKPLVKVVALDELNPAAQRRFGFMAGQMTIPDDFDTMLQEDVIALFEGEE